MVRSSKQRARCSSCEKPKCGHGWKVFAITGESREIALSGGGGGGGKEWNAISASWVASGMGGGGGQRGAGSFVPTVHSEAVA